MSKGVNKWIGIGNVCGDPQAASLPSGGTVVNVTIACNDSYKDKNTGANVDKTEFVRLVFFNKLAEIVAQYVKKGSKLYIEGSLRTRSWEKDGVKQYATEIVASEMQMLDGKPADSSGQQSGQAPRQSQAPAQSAPADNFGWDDGDTIPF